MKVILLILFVSNGSYNVGTVETLQYEVSSITHCEVLAENLNDIFEVDPVLKSVKVSMNCLEVPK